MNDHDNGGAERKAALLRKKIRPFKPSTIETVEDCLNSLSECSFQGRRLGTALKIYNEMLSRPCFKVLTLSGAMIPAGMDEIICEMIEFGMINCIVSTGANITHGILNAFAPHNQAHYLGSEKANDAELRNFQINRIFDTYLPESEYMRAENELLVLLRQVFRDSKKRMTGENGTQFFVTRPSELFKSIGMRLPGRCFVKIAALYDVPIFCGATSDSELALDLAKYRVNNQLNVILDEIGDVLKFSNYIRRHNCHGTIIVGGGVPRNWAQQIFPFLDQLDLHNKQGEPLKFKGYQYSIRIHTAVAEDGGLSGCTLSESMSWGKYREGAKHVSIWGDATIALPILISAAVQSNQLIKLTPELVSEVNRTPSS